MEYSAYSAVSVSIPPPNSGGMSYNGGLLANVTPTKTEFHSDFKPVSNQDLFLTQNHDFSIGKPQNGTGAYEFKGELGFEPMKFDSSWQTSNLHSSFGQKNGEEHQGKPKQTGQTSYSGSSFGKETSFAGKEGHNENPSQERKQSGRAGKTEFHLDLSKVNHQFPPISNQPVQVGHSNYGVQSLPNQGNQAKPVESSFKAEKLGEPYKSSYNFELSTKAEPHQPSSNLGVYGEPFKSSFTIDPMKPIDYSFKAGEPFKSSYNFGPVDSKNTHSDPIQTNLYFEPVKTDFLSSFGAPESKHNSKGIEFKPLTHYGNTMSHSEQPIKVDFQLGHAPQEKSAGPVKTESHFSFEPMKFDGLGTQSKLDSGIPSFPQEVHPGTETKTSFGFTGSASVPFSADPLITGGKFDAFSTQTSHFDPKPVKAVDF